MKQIPVGGGKFALVDDDDYEELSKHKWHLDSSGYACRMVKITMHRKIAKTPSGKSTDHINGKALDNRKSNLRHCSVWENNFNKRGSSPLGKGVSSTRNGKFQASIKARGKRKYLGVFKTAAEAHAAYRTAATEQHGEFACVNN